MKKLFDLIPGWLFLILIIGTIAIFIDPIVGRLRRRIISVNKLKLREDAKIICFRDDFPVDRQIQACADGKKYAEADSNSSLENQYLKRLCNLNDPSSCYDWAVSRIFKLSKDEYRKLIEKACREGRGGDMRACGELGGLIQNDNPVLSKEYLKFACANGHNKYCKQ